MSIRWDPVLARATARELQQELAGARLRAIRLDGAEGDVVLLFRHGTLLWRLHPTRGFPLLFPAREPAPGDLSLACTVRSVSCPPDERVVVMDLSPVRGRRGRVRLIVELMGNQWNAVVVEGEESRITHVLRRRSGKRPLAVGARYHPPPPSARAGADGALTREAWDRIVAEARAGAPEAMLVKRLAWSSPLNVGGLLHPEGGYALWCRLASGTPSEPMLQDDSRGLQPYPLALPGVSVRPVRTLLAGFLEAADACGSGGAAAALIPPHTLGVLRQRARAALRRFKRVQHQWETLEDAETLRATADLLLARYGQVPTGATRVVLEDFEGGTREVELDPALSPHENARDYYRRASRARRARERLPGLLDAARGEAERLEELLARAAAGRATPNEVSAAVPEAGRAPSGRTSDGGPFLPYRTFRSSGGLEIRVGRGARHNDDLTFRHSAPEDIWLHARHAAGAHVILRWTRAGAPPARDLEDAAVLAALHSRARTSGSVPVDWTRRKYVRKPRGSAPGSVAPARVKTLFVEPDESRAAALRSPDPWPP